MDYWGLKMKIFGSPRTLDDNDALWGLDRARYFAYMNRERAEAGLDPIQNDEELDPDLAIHRELMHLEHEARDLRAIGIEPPDPPISGFDGYPADDPYDD